VFNTFVFLQVFNEINSRKVDLQKNVFSGIFTNWIFVGVIVVTCVVQIIIVEVGGQAIRYASFSR
jgi:Ca2+-transporting ATPase